MKTLKTKFKKNNKNYILLKRNEKVALYGLTGDYTKEYTSYEVSKIYIQKSKIMFNKQYPDTEVISDNSQFGKDFSRSFSKLNLAENYFNLITETIKK